MVPFKEVVTEKIIHIFTLHPIRIQQDRLCMCNITMRHICPTMADVQKPYYIFWGCACSPKYPACNVHAPYYHLWPVQLNNIFLHYLINRTIFEKRFLNIKCVFWYPLQILLQTLFNRRRNERDMIINVYSSSCKVPIILVRC